MGRCLRGLIAASLIVQLSGCSFLFVHRAPPNVPPGVWVECTEGKTFPILDAVFGASMLISAVGGGATSGSSSSGEGGNAGVAVAAGVDALVSIGVLYSAYAGFKWTNRCSRLHEDAEARGVYGPQPYYPYPPQPYPYPYPPQQPAPQGPPGSTAPAPQPQPQPPAQPAPQ